MILLYILSLIPVVALLFAPFLANYVEPYVLGLPFLLFWIILWVCLGSVFLGIVYLFDSRNKVSKDE